jgi:hypothetical protein
MSDNQNQSDNDYEEKKCRFCSLQYKPNGHNECCVCHELYCEKCKVVTCEYIILGGENDPETAAQCKQCKSIYHFEEC